MDMGACPPDDVWDDLPTLSRLTARDDTLVRELRGHLRTCAACRERRALSGGRNPARRYANWATFTFGLVGLALALTVCFRAPLPQNSTMRSAQRAPTSPPLAPAVLTRIEPLVSSGPAGE